VEKLQHCHKNFEIHIFDYLTFRKKSGCYNGCQIWRLPASHGRWLGAGCRHGWEPEGEGNGRTVASEWEGVGVVHGDGGQPRNEESEEVARGAISLRSGTSGRGGWVSAHVIAWECDASRRIEDEWSGTIGPGRLRQNGPYLYQLDVFLFFLLKALL